MLCAAQAYDQTDWAKIVELYDVQYRLKPSPIVALNRVMALGEITGLRRALRA